MVDIAKYSEEDYLLLSGVQHYAFCPRQWALIHIENIWVENYLTASGRILHNKAHDGSLAEKRGNKITFRSLRVSSSRLGISGECDVVEFNSSRKGIPLKGYEGLWLPFPVEYKRGKTKISDCDRLQLCAQAVCLEEMLCCEIEKGALFYGEPRRREQVDLTNDLRGELESTIKEMHRLFSRQHTPKAKKGKQCNACSLKDYCLPKLSNYREKSVRNYMERNIQ
jgi:CRISPR-associated exonuclease Cas4